VREEDVRTKRVLVGIPSTGTLLEPLEHPGARLLRFASLLAPWCLVLNNTNARDDRVLLVAVPKCQESQSVV
jgi:hypothetical protein